MVNYQGVALQFINFIQLADFTDWVLIAFVDNRMVFLKLLVAAAAVG